MTPPDFWYDPTRSPPIFLRALSWIYALLRYVHRVIRRPVCSPIPTICVGNITVGGSGKTPVVRALRALFSDRAVVVLLRGYGGKARGPKRVTSDDAPCTVGDESLIHASDGVTFIARDRIAGIKAIQAEAHDPPPLIILDDGLQNPRLRAMVNILIIDGAVGFGNGYLIPAGPLREPLRAALIRTHICIIIGTDRTNAAATIATHNPLLPIFKAHIVPDATHIDGTQRYMAVAGIGRPQKFYETLAALDLNIIATRDFPDHHTYQKPEVNALFNDARRQNTILITTEKDAVKIRTFTDIPFAVLPVRAVFDDQNAVQAAVQARLHP